jgi:hypothetical protein
MGSRTHDTLISEALLLAGNANLTSRASVWLNTWLRSQYTAWPWPFCIRSLSDYSLPEGTQSLSFGNGSGGVTLEIHQIRDPVYLYNSEKTQRYEARIRELVGVSADNDERAINTTTKRGIPSEVKVRADASIEGKWTLYFDPVPDRALLLAFDYHVIPADVSGSTKPRYPNDRTMIQAIYAEAMKYMDRQDVYQTALSVLASMVVDDRLKYGEVPGTNGTWGLDAKTFRY